MVWGGGGKGYVKNVCMYAALFRLSSGIVTQTARCRARRRRRRESVPSVRAAAPCVTPVAVLRRAEECT